MRIMTRPVWVAVLAMMLAGGAARAGDDGLVLRAAGWYRGISSISEGTITCEIPTVETAIPDSTSVLGMENTFGVPTQHFPDRENPFADPCGGWLQTWNSMRTQGINLTKVVTRYKVAQGNRRFGRTGLVAMRQNLPVACRDLRRQVLFLGNRLEPNNPFAPPSSSSGRPNTAFVPIFPQFSADLIGCIRENFATLPPDAFESLQLVSRTKVFGIADNGDKFRSNSVRFTLTLSHTCGNGRIDNFEECDPTVAGPGGAPVVQCTSLCNGVTCLGNPTRACATDADCTGVCGDQGTTTECVCFN